MPHLSKAPTRCELSNAMSKLAGSVRSKKSDRDRAFLAWRLGPHFYNQLAHYVSNHNQDECVWPTTQERDPALAILLHLRSRQARVRARTYSCIAKSVTNRKENVMW